jgi:hypothetical protein
MMIIAIEVIIGRWLDGAQRAGDDRPARGPTERAPVVGVGRWASTGGRSTR